MLSTNAFLEFKESVGSASFTAAVTYLGLSVDDVLNLLVRELESIQQPSIYGVTTFFSLGESMQEAVFKTNIGDYSIRIRSTAVKNSYDIYVINLRDNLTLNTLTLTAATEPAD